MTGGTQPVPRLRDGAGVPPATRAKVGRVAPRAPRAGRGMNFQPPGPRVPAPNFASKHRPHPRWGARAVRKHGRLPAPGVNNDMHPIYIKLVKPQALFPAFFTAGRRPA